MPRRRPRELMPLAPLEAMFPHEPSRHALARRLGVDAIELRRWAEMGGIPWDRADAIATSLGKHPGLIWPREWWCDFSELEREEAAVAAAALERKRALDRASKARTRANETADERERRLAYQRAYRNRPDEMERRRVAARERYRANREQMLAAQRDRDARRRGRREDSEAC